MNLKLSSPRSRKLLLWAFAGWSGLIALMLLLPHPPGLWLLVDLSGLICDDEIGGETRSLVFHGILFGVWTALIALILPTFFRIRSLPQIVLGALSCTFLFGGLTECLQLFIPDRQGDWLDLLMDMLGGVVCLGMLLYFARRSEQRRSTSCWPQEVARIAKETIATETQL